MTPENTEVVIRTMSRVRHEIYRRADWQKQSRIGAEICQAIRVQLLRQWTLVLWEVRDEPW